MTYNTGNPLPSIDPRDLDDNAQAFDRFLQSSSASEPDRLGVQRKTWNQMELDAAALVSPNVSALAALTAALDKAFFFNTVTPVGMGTYTITSFVRSLGSAANGAAYRALIGAVGASDNITGSAASLTTSRTIAASGDATWAVSFNGSANVTAALTLAASGVGAGTYGSVTVNAKGLVTAAAVAAPIANGGTGATTALAAGTNLGTAVVGTNTDQLAKSSMIQAEIANKRAWTAYTPTITAQTGTYTTTVATGQYMVAFGICHFQVRIALTTVGTGVNPVFTLPFAVQSGINVGMPLGDAYEGALSGKAGLARVNTGLATGLATGSAGSSDPIHPGGNGSVVLVSGSYPIN